MLITFQSKIVDSAPPSKAPGDELAHSDYFVSGLVLTFIIMSDDGVKFNLTDYCAVTPNSHCLNNDVAVTIASDSDNMFNNQKLIEKSVTSSVSPSCSYSVNARLSSQRDQVYINNDI